MANLVTTCCDANSQLVRRDFAARFICGTNCTPNGAGGATEFSYFASTPFTQDEMTMTFPGAPNFGVMEPDLPSTFEMFPIASAGNSANITSSGANLQYINTVEAGSYEFAITFSIENSATTDQSPDMTIGLGDSGGTFYTFPANPAIFTVGAQWEPTTLAGTSLTNQTYFAVMHGVVDLAANAVTAILIGPGLAQPSPYDFGTFNVTVKKLT